MRLIDERAPGADFLFLRHRFHTIFTWPRSNSHSLLTLHLPLPARMRAFFLPDPPARRVSHRHVLLKNSRQQLQGNQETCHVKWATADLHRNKGIRYIQ